MKPTDRNYEALCAAAGYTQCPCCGYDTISSDSSKPELCSDCEEAGCEADGSEALCDCGDEESECAYWIDMRKQDLSGAPYVAPACKPCGTCQVCGDNDVEVQS